MTDEPAAHPPEAFLETQDNRRFSEFCDARRRNRYIGLCYGPPGVGKTLSTRHYAAWDALEAVFSDSHFWMDPPARPELAACRTIVYTPSMTTTPKRLADEVSRLRRMLHLAVEAAQQGDQEEPDPAPFDDRWTELVTVDEADWLKFPTLEQVRDAYDRGHFGLVLIGMPGLERRMARFAQLYSRLGFVHQLRPRSPPALRLLLAHKWAQLGPTLRTDGVTDAEVVVAIIRMTSSNFRLVQRLFSQIERILELNQLRAITPEVVDAARQSLVIGTA